MKKILLLSLLALILTLSNFSYSYSEPTSISEVEAISAELFEKYPNYSVFLRNDLKIAVKDRKSNSIIYLVSLEDIDKILNDSMNSNNLKKINKDVIEILKILRTNFEEILHITTVVNIIEEIVDYIGDVEKSDIYRERLKTFIQSEDENLKNFSKEKRIAHVKAICNKYFAKIVDKTLIALTKEFPQYFFDIKKERLFTSVSVYEKGKKIADIINYGFSIGKNIYNPKKEKSINKFMERLSSDSMKKCIEDNICLKNMEMCVEIDDKIKNKAEILQEINKIYRK